MHISIHLSQEQERDWGQEQEQELLAIHYWVSFSVGKPPLWQLPDAQTESAALRASFSGASIGRVSGSGGGSREPRWQVSRSRARGSSGFVGGTGKSCFARLYHITRIFNSSSFNSSCDFPSALTSMTVRSCCAMNAWRRFSCKPHCFSTLSFLRAPMSFKRVGPSCPMANAAQQRRISFPSNHVPPGQSPLACACRDRRAPRKGEYHRINRILWAHQLLFGRGGRWAVMLLFSEQQHKVGTSIPLKVHTGPIRNRLSTPPVFPSTSLSVQSMEPMHWIQSPIPHTTTWLKRSQHTLQIVHLQWWNQGQWSVSLSLPPWFVAVLICDTEISHPQRSYP